MHREVAAHFASLFREQRREQELGTERAAEECERACARTRAERRRRRAVLREQPSPDLDVPVLYGGEPLVEMLLLGIGLGFSEHAIEECSVGLVLPVVLEGVEVGCRGWRGGGRHPPNIARTWRQG